MDGLLNAIENKENKCASSNLAIIANMDLILIEDKTTLTALKLQFKTNLKSIN